MKKFAIMLAAAFCFAATTQGAMVLVDSFETYAVGSSIHGQGTWEASVNSNGNGDPGGMTVKAEGGNQVLSITNAEAGDSDGLDTVALTTSIPTISDLGTIYMRVKGDGMSNVAFNTNDLDPGFCGGDCQGITNWANQASIAQFAMGANGDPMAFKARNGGVYESSSNASIQSGVWYEMWIQLNVGTQSSQYFIRTLGDTAAPTQVLNAAGGADWGFRFTGYTALSNLKMNVDNSPAWNCGEACVLAETLVDSIGVNTSALTLETVPEPASLSLLALGSLLAIRRR